MNNNDLLKFSRDIRRCIINAAFNSKQNVHIGGALSIADILSVLFGYIMNYNPNNPEDDKRDRFILSKGHSCIGLYAVMNILGIITDDELKENYLTDGGYFAEHPSKKISKGIECTSGSLGMGLSFGIGKALAAKLNDKKYNTFVIAGDGECNEGQIWEAVITAKQYKLDNLLLIIDRNKFQLDGATKDIIDLNISSSFQGFGWDVFEVDGHDIDALKNVISLSKKNKNCIPKAIIANTIKGKGISFMENNNMWHHGMINKEQYEIAIKEL